MKARYQHLNFLKLTFFEQTVFKHSVFGFLFLVHFSPQICSPVYMMKVYFFVIKNNNNNNNWVWLSIAESGSRMEAWEGGGEGGYARSREVLSELREGKHVR